MRFLKILIKEQQSSIRLARIVFFISIVLSALGTGLLPIDITLHGVVPTFIGIISLYLYQEAIVLNKDDRRAFHLFAYWLIAFVIYLLSGCACYLCVMKARMVLISSIAIYLFLLWRLLKNRKTRNNGVEQIKGDVF